MDKKQYIYKRRDKNKTWVQDKIIKEHPDVKKQYRYKTVEGEQRITVVKKKVDFGWEGAD